ncbi:MULTISPECIES: hypothetical protein [Halomonadaceae]|nr:MULTISPECIES: hypothetical protein [Halomonas]
MLRFDPDRLRAENTDCILGAPNAFVRVTAQQRLEAEINGSAQDAAV